MPPARSARCQTVFPHRRRRKPIDRRRRPAWGAVPPIWCSRTARSSPSMRRSHCPGNRGRGRADRGGRAGRGHGRAYRSGDAGNRSQRQDRHSRAHRRPRAYGPRGAAQRVPGARPRALDPRHTGADRRARAGQATGRVDRHHADRRSALLLRRARDPGREALADAQSSSMRRRRTIRSISARSGAIGAEPFRWCPAPTPRR